MTFESAGLLIVAIYIWLPPASYVVFLTTLVYFSTNLEVYILLVQSEFTLWKEYILNKNVGCIS